MPGKSYKRWEAVKAWCRANPHKTAGIVTSDGIFTVSFVLSGPPEDYIVHEDERLE